MSQEIEHLRTLLFSPDQRNAFLGLELLVQQPEYMPRLASALCVLSHFAKDEQLQAEAGILLRQAFANKQIKQFAEPFAVFEALKKSKRLNWASFYKRLQQYEAVKAIYEPLMLQNELYTEYFERLAVVLLRQFEQYKLAYQYFKKVIDLPQTSLSTKVNFVELMLNVFLKEEDYRADAPLVLQLLNEVIAHYPQQAAQFYHAVGLINELYIEDMAAAKIAYKTAFAQNPKLALSKHNLARIYFVHDQNYAAAKSLLDELVKNYPKRLDYWYALACVVWEGEQDLATAEQILKHILKLSRNKHHQAASKLGDLYVSQDKGRAALDAYKMSLAQQPNDADTHKKYETLVQRMKD